MWSLEGFVRPSFLSTILSSYWFTISLGLHLLLEVLLLIIVLGPPEQKDVWFRRYQ